MSVCQSVACFFKFGNEMGCSLPENLRKNIGGSGVVRWSSIEERGPGFNSWWILVGLVPSKKVCANNILLSVQILGA